VIQCRAVLPGGVEVARLWVCCPPRAGERLLLAGDAGDAAEAQCGTRRFVVVEVEHCLAERAIPETTLREADHTVSLLVEPA
jgi:hypothetical protein